jgi:hypothetical protein
MSATDLVVFGKSRSTLPSSPQPRPVLALGANRENVAIDFTFPAYSNNVNQRFLAIPKRKLRDGGRARIGRGGNL